MAKIKKGCRETDSLLKVKPFICLFQQFIFVDAIENNFAFIGIEF